MGSRPVRIEQLPHALVRALQQEGLAARTYEEAGVCYVHVSPPRSPAAGTRVVLTGRTGEPCFYNEWGAEIGHDPADVIQRILWWFGKASARP